MDGAPVGERRDAFGASVSERVWRRLAGTGLAVVIAAGAALLEPGLLPWILFGAAVVYVLGVPLSWAIERRRRGRSRWLAVLRHVGAGAALGVLVATVLTFAGGHVVWFPLWLFFSVLSGVTVAGAAAWGGLALSERWIRPVGVAGLVVAIIVLPVGAWLVQRPPAPYDYVVLNPTLEAQRAFGDAHGLATAIADGFERQVAAGRSRTAHSTWVAVGEDITRRELGDSEAWLAFMPDEELPSLHPPGERVRLVTTIFRGEDDRACVVVTSDETRVEPRECGKLELSGS